MATTGATLPQSAVTASETPWSDNDWDNIIRLYGAGSASVTAPTFDAGDQTYVLKAYNFNFSAIPDGSTIQGVTCVINAIYAVAPASIDLVQLLDINRAKVGTNKAATPTALTETPTDYTFGGSADTWGNSLTAAWVKDADFGVAMGCLAGASDNVDVFIDYVTLNITYTAPTSVTLDTVSASAVGIPIDVVPGAVSKTLDAAVLTATGITAAISAPPPSASVTLDAAVATATGIPLDIVPGTVTKILGTASLTATGIALDVVPGAISKAMGTASLTAVGVSITVSAPANETTIVLDSAVSTATGIAAAINAPVTVLLKHGELWFNSSRQRTIGLGTGSLTATGIAADVVPGAVSKVLATGSLTAVGVAVSVSLGGGAQSVELAAAVLTATGQALDVQPGAVSIALSTASLTATGQAVKINQTVKLSTATLTATGQTLSVVVEGEAQTINLAAASLTATGQALDVVPGTVSKVLGTASLTATGQAISVTISTDLSTASLTASGQALDVVPGAISILLGTAAISAERRSLIVTAQALLVAVAGTRYTGRRGFAGVSVGTGIPPIELEDGSGFWEFEDGTWVAWEIDDK